VSYDAFILVFRELDIEVTEICSKWQKYIDKIAASKYLMYRVSHELRSLLRESVPYVKIYRYNPKHLYPKLNGYGDNGKRSLKVWQLLHTY